MIISLFFVLFVLFWLWNKKRYAIVFLMLVTTNGFKIKFFGFPLTWDYNYLWVFENVFLARGLFSSPFRRRLKNDRIMRFICISYLFLIVHFVFSVALDREEFVWAFSVLRQVSGPILLYVPLSTIPLHEWKKAYKYLCVIVSLVCVFYFLQFFGFSIFLSNEGDSAGVIRSGYVRCIEFFVITSFFLYRRKIAAIPFLIPVVGGGARGSMTAILISFLWTFRKKMLKWKYVVIFSVVAAIGMAIYLNLGANNYRRYNISYIEEVQRGLDFSFISNPKNYLVNSHIRMDGNGTFGFRMAMLVERFQYVIKNPQYLLFGCGMMAEESPKNTFRFFLGTAQDRYGGINQIMSVDILWVSFVLRFGLCGVLFWVVFFYLFYKKFSNADAVAAAGRTFVLYLLIHSFGTLGPFNTANMSLLVLLTIGQQNDNTKEIRYESVSDNRQL